MVHATLRGRLATLTANAAAPSSSSDHTGIRSRTGTSVRAGNANGTSTAIATANTTSTPNAQRHEPYCANRPPAAGPSSVPTPHIAETRADALVHRDGGSVELITAYPRPASSPPAEPWTTRPTSSNSIVGASAQNRLPSANTASPQRYAHRGPTRASTALTVVAATTEATRYTVVTQT